nr:unnamed protein product [Callosobruchus chinensis]
MKNAFNSARWNDILAALQNHFRVPSHLLRIITDYLDDRELVYQTTEGLQRKKVSAKSRRSQYLAQTYGISCMTVF